MKRFTVQVPVSMQITVEAPSAEWAERAAAHFTEGLAPSEHYIGGYNSATEFDAEIIEAGLEVCSDDSFEVEEVSDNE